METALLNAFAFDRLKQVHEFHLYLLNSDSPDCSLLALLDGRW